MVVEVGAVALVPVPLVVTPSNGDMKADATAVLGMANPPTWSKTAAIKDRTMVICLIENVSKVITK